MLGAVGLTAQEERIYLLLLDQPGLTPMEFAALLGQSERLARVYLDALEAKGFVARSSGGPGYLPAAPDVVVRSLIASKQDELRRVERAIARLLKRAREAVARRGRLDEILEIVLGEEALFARVDQLQRTAQDEVVGFITTTCPYPVPQGIFDPSRMRGARIRMVYERQALNVPHLLDAARRQLAVGEQVRVVNALPVTLALFDRRHAVVVESNEVRSALLVSRSALLKALLRYFETIWERAAPLASASNGAERGPLESEHEDLVTLLAAGFKDDAIARSLGLSARTMDRRMSMLMKSLDASTRFQAGWLAAHQVSGKHKRPGGSGSTSAL